ncbi:hypothetical protein AHiyo8_16070 [Arthrobacter sp. Hiyo8]|nr:hypothetical protein AHiyo8_16070 [Arthrobacter sp. Hiyo8]
MGRQPIRNVAIPMVRRDATRVPLRPNLSPKWPKTMEPSGRATKATPNTAKELNSWVVSSAVGKKSLGKTSTAAVA